MMSASGPDRSPCSSQAATGAGEDVAEENLWVDSASAAGRGLQEPDLSDWRFHRQALQNSSLREASIQAKDEGLQHGFNCGFADAAAGAYAVGLLEGLQEGRASFLGTSAQDPAFIGPDCTVYPPISAFEALAWTTHPAQDRRPPLTAPEIPQIHQTVRAASLHLFSKGTVALEQAAALAARNPGLQRLFTECMRREDNPSDR